MDTLTDRRGSSSRPIGWKRESLNALQPESNPCTENLYLNDT